MRARLTFTAERAFARTLALVAGVVQRTGRAAARASRAAARRGRRHSQGHFHAAAFPFHPFKKGRLELKDTVRTLFEAGGLHGRAAPRCTTTARSPASARANSRAAPAGSRRWTSERPLA